MLIFSDAYVLDTSTLPDSSTVRHKNCEILLKCAVNRCQQCSNYRKTLQKFLGRTKEKTDDQMTSPASHVNYRYTLMYPSIQLLYSM